jgi:alpha-tubulin suppressor-like RCC1 family protein
VQSIANQQTLNATVVQSIANQQTLNATVVQSISQLSTNQQTLNASVVQSIGQLSANHQTLNATVVQSIASQKTLNYTFNALLLSGNTACSNSIDSVSCGCKSGYSGNSFSCSDVNECILNSHNCHANALCVNTVGSFNCSCNPGFSGNGYACSDIDECALNTHNCISSASCRNTPGDFFCTSRFSAGGSHTCALTTSGAAKCWGRGNSGQLGNGATSNPNTPVGVSGMSSGVASIFAGESHTCALTTSGAAKCWGAGGNGRLGNGATSNSLTPMDVSGMSSGVVAIYAGWSHTCALTTSGAAKCWGAGGDGLLGNGATVDSLTPVDVSGMSSGVASISAGGSHTCALTTSGAAKCWGKGDYGQLGNGATSNSNTPVGVSGMSSGVVVISAGGSHTCALTTSGAVKCWGAGGFGQLGNGATSNYNTPVDVSGMSSGVVAISVGIHHNCALTTSGAAKCWGGGFHGRLGNGATSDYNTPVGVSGMSSGVAVISAGGEHTCALTTSGAAKCWGRGDYGQLGNGADSTFNTPVTVTNF